ncbi:hypothetical protein AVEN_118377-1 [Araneus ventricosus]|uniref:Uncharacterized protein n=1 Tax=Araneus ventricosus TaxID=182803 RepID=A0A4Y2B5F4_ARAVE|nr:hypothetical protein AVEN_118377-1 [Araneus ventricosus]
MKLPFENGRLAIRSRFSVKDRSGIHGRVIVALEHMVTNAMNRNEWLTLLDIVVLKITGQQVTMNTCQGVTLRTFPPRISDNPNHIGSRYRPYKSSPNVDAEVLLYAKLSCCSLVFRLP